MNRTYYYDEIYKRLDFLSFHIEREGKLNLLNINIACEIFYLRLFNLLFGYSISDSNLLEQNATAIDLIDKENKIALQVSSTVRKDKVQGSLDGIKKRGDLKGYTFKFISISKPADNLMDKEYEIPAGISFDPAKEIYDIDKIKRLIKTFDPPKLEEILEFLKQEIDFRFSSENLSSALVDTINILAETDLENSETELDFIAYDIDRKICENNLDEAVDIINEFSKQYNTAQAIYTEYDKNGKNTRYSIPNKVKKVYNSCKRKFDNEDKIFNCVRKKVTAIIIGSNCISKYPYELIEDCVDIIVVHAFIECKIFKKPKPQ